MTKCKVRPHLAEAGGRRARKCSGCLLSVTIPCATWPPRSTCMSHFCVKVLLLVPHVTATTRVYTRVHTHTSSSGPLYCTLLPGTSSFTQTMLPDHPSAAWPMYTILLNFHCLDTPQAPLQAPASIFILHVFQPELLWMQRTETRSSWLNNKVCEEGMGYYKENRMSWHPPREPPCWDVEWKVRQLQFLALPPGKHDLPSWCLCSSLHTCSILLSVDS